MAEEPASPPPQSIVIGQLPHNPATQPVGQDERAALSETTDGGLQHDGGALSPTSASGVTKEAVENYITVMDVKDNSTGTAILAAIFLLIIPFLFLLDFDFYSLDEGSCGLCFGSIGLGTVFAIISATESTKTRKNQENAKLRLMKEAGLQSPPGSKVPLYVGGASLAVLVLSAFLSEAFYYYEIEIINGLMNIFGFLGLLSSGIFHLEGDRRRKKTIAQHVKAIVDRETNKPGD